MPNTTANKKDIPQLPVGFETVPAEDYEAREKLTTARVALLMKAPWFGNMATRLPLVNADEWLPTAATDGRYFYYNSFYSMTIRTQCLQVFWTIITVVAIHVIYS